MTHSLQGVYRRGFNWVDESEEGLEDLCGFYDVDYRKVGATIGRSGWLRDGEHVMKHCRGGGKDGFVSMEVLEF